MKKCILFVLIIGVLFSTFNLLSCEKKLCASAEENLKDESLAISCKSALLYDANSGTIIYEKNATQRLPIASMTKLASLKIVFDAIEKGDISEDTLVKVSKHSADTEGSSAFLDEKSEYKVSDLIMTVIVASANDSTVALAEAVCGTEDLFVEKMNELVRELNLKDTNFINSTGLPAVEHYSSAKDISKIYATICDNKIYKKYSKIWRTELVHPSGRKTEIVNTNRLIKSYEGCDSGKTGFTNDAGYCLSASATRGGMRLISVVIGAKDSKVRFNETATLFNYGFNNYENKVIISKEKPLYLVDVKGSTKDNINIYAKNDYIAFIKKGEKFEYKTDYIIEKIKAPKIKGESVGVLYIIDKNNIVIHEEELIIKEDLPKIKIKDILNKIYREI